MAAARLVDQYGNPISSAALREEFAAPTFGSVRPVWNEPVLAGITPVALSEILRQAARGYPDRFFGLAMEMEERDLHYAAVLGTRKRAITGVEPIVVAASNSKQDEKLADAVREIVEQPAFIDDYLTDLLDALGKGYSIVETMWERSASEWWPGGYRWRDQRHFVLDKIDGRTLRMKAEGYPEGVDLPPFKFSVHRPKLKSGLPVNGGLARLAAWAFLFKNYTLKDWMAFLEVFGMPLRVGKYGPGAKDDDKRVLLQAVRALSTDAAAIIPKEMEIEFVEAASSTGTAVFGAKADYLDKQVSKGVLGQTMTTDNGSSLSQATVHENVRHDIARADARQTAVTANREVIRPYVDLNFGPQERYPTLVIPVSEAEDTKALADIVAKLVPLGLEIGMNDMRQRIGFDAPEDKDVILRPARSTPSKAAPKATGEDEAEGDDEDAPDEDAAQAAVCPSCGQVHATAAVTALTDELDALIEEGLADWEGGFDALVKPLRGLFEGAESYDDLIAGLDVVIGRMEAGPLADRLAKLTMKARGLGDTVPTT